MPAKSKKQSAATVISLEDWDDVNTALGELSLIEPEKAALEAKLAAAIQKAKDERSPTITELGERIALLTTAIGDFTIAHREEMDGPTKTRVLVNGSIGLRLSPPKITTTKGTTWPKVLERVIALLPPRLRAKFIRTKEELDKEQLKAAISNGELPEDKRKALGIALTQTEEVYYVLKAEQAT